MKLTSKQRHTCGKGINHAGTCRDLVPEGRVQRTKSQEGSHGGARMPV